MIVKYFKVVIYLILHRYCTKMENLAGGGDNASLISFARWDLNGNMTRRRNRDSDRYLCWDEENRLSAVSDQAEETQLSVYLYDANGERAWKFSGTTNLLLINGQILSQQTALNKTLYVNPYMVITEYNYTKHYFIESERIATKLGSGFGAAAVMPGDTSLAFIVNDAHHLSEHLYDYCKRQITCVEHPGNFHISPHLEPAYNNTNAIEKFQYFYHTDHLGSSSFITNASGNAEQHLLYMPFGELFVSQMTGSFDSRYKFTAKERDEETGYDYFGARYYTSDESIWLSVDPMSDKYPSTSPYIYCIGNPMKFVDYNGMDTILFNNKGQFGNPIPDNQDYDTYVKVNNDEFKKNKINYNSKGELRNRHSNKRMSKDFINSIDIVTLGSSYANVYTVNDYSKAKDIFEFFADNTSVEWGHLILKNSISGEYLNKISTSHNEKEILFPGFSKTYTPVDVRHSHPDGGFFSPEDRYFYEYYKNINSEVVTRIYKAGYYHNFDNKKEYPNLQIVPGYK